MISEHLGEGNNIDTSTGSPPRSRMRAAFAGVRARAVTSCPAATRAATAGLPMAPVPPSTNTFTTRPGGRLRVRSPRSTLGQIELSLDGPLKSSPQQRTLQHTEEPR